MLKSAGFFFTGWKGSETLIACFFVAETLFLNIARKWVWDMCDGPTKTRVKNEGGYVTDPFAFVTLDGSFFIIVF